MVHTNTAMANMWRLPVQMIFPLPGDMGALEALGGEPWEGGGRLGWGLSKGAGCREQEREASHRISGAVRSGSGGCG